MNKHFQKFIPKYFIVLQIVILYDQNYLELIDDLRGSQAAGVTHTAPTWACAQRTLECAIILSNMFSRLHVGNAFLFHIFSSQ